jgi:tight adherence protein B
MDNIREQMPEFLRIVENGLRCGHSVVQALQLAKEEMDTTWRNEIQTVLNDLAQGRSLLAALDSWLQRTPHPDLDLWIATLKVQREVGGNLADKLQLLGQIMAQRGLAGPFPQC